MVCECAALCTCVGAQVCTVHMKARVWSRVLFLRCHPPVLWDRNLSIAEMWSFLRSLGWLGNESQRFACFYQLWDYKHVTSGIFLHGFWWSNLRPQLTYLPSPSLLVLRNGCQSQCVVYKPKGNWAKCIWQLPGLLLRICSSYNLIPKII